MKKITIFIALITISLTITGNSFAAWGDLDTGFGTLGVKQETSTKFRAYGTAVQSDGKILVTGRMADTNFFLIRYLSNGQRDSAFGSGGLVIDQIADSSGISVLPMADGKIVVSGRGNGACAVWRFNSNGSPDTSFGTGGMVSQASYGSCQDVAVQSGKLIVSGFILNGTDQLMRLNADGSKDLTFGSHGIANVGIKHLRHIVVDSAGKIIVAGNASDPGETLIGVQWDRKLSSGGGDLFFFPGSTSPCLATGGLVRQSTGKIVLSCWYDGGAPDGTSSIFRYNSNGTVDSVSATHLGSSTFLGQQTDGRIVSCAYNSDCYRYDANLNLQSTFSASPNYTFEIAPIVITMQADNKLLFTGLRNGGRMTTVRALAN